MSKNTTTFFNIRKGSIEEVIELSKKIPELIPNIYSKNVYIQRLQTVPHLILVAELNGQLIGFKVGYQRTNDQRFYSWLGGILPDHRRSNIAAQLAQHQELWARQKGYIAIWLKTYNRHRSMLLFAIQQEFNIIGFESKNATSEHRIIMEKIL